MNWFRRDEQSHITMVGRQITVSSQLAGPNDLVTPISHELEEAVKLVTKKCIKFRREEATAPKRVRGKFILCPKALSIRSWLRFNHVLPLTSSDVDPSANPSPVKVSTVVHRARSKIPAGRRLVVSSEDKARGQGVMTLRMGADDDLEDLFMSGGETPVVLSPEAVRLTTWETPAIKIVYGKGAHLSLLGEPATPTSFAPSSGLKVGAGSGATHSYGETAELSRRAPRLKSRLPSPPSVPMKRGREVDPSKEKESSTGKRGRTTPSSDSDDDGATLTLMRRRKFVRDGPSENVGQDKTEKLQPSGSPREVVAEAAEVAAVTVASSTEDAPPPTVVEGALVDALLSTAPTSAISGASKEATGVCLAGGEGVLAVGRVESRSSNADNAQGKSPAAEFELEVLSLENVELIAGRSITQVWLV
ncbi:hypothetical protein PanWU01x14_300010 [Parasponia andersonii]|uniref:Uncharacterized protein n=1 Tax=Parasponia andersonii TaxID=3476 RepID=A0A2P5AU97_PARAD|nr:hypothetical protein PanWU01x14_300010 [Parasponia andersonii]